ncbi:hypothetical protein FGIG_10093 [Fasciola gigantica]|uniref:CUB domain-containing protein n=1 Tax=Fasciola gigantica TaxID=46835 RepID=A0A504YG00_FASGI|nr:hypothetical protein FGIG_10093 [Fasciola gigantica]
MNSFLATGFGIPRSSPIYGNVLLSKGRLKVIRRMKSVVFIVVVLLLWHRANTSEIACSKPDLDKKEKVNIPGDGDEFPETFTCVYEFGSTKGNTSKLEIPLFNISCDTGYVKFSFEEQNLEDRGKKFCDAEKPGIFYYNEGSVYMKVMLIKKSPVNKISYQVTEVASMGNFTCQNGSKLGTDENIPAANQILPDDFECKYEFVGGEEKHIKLEFKKFYIEESPFCAERYVEIGDLVNRKATPGRRFCGSVIPNEIVIPSQNAYMKLINDGCVRNVELISEIQGTSSPVKKFCGQMEPKERIYPFEKCFMQLNLNPMKIGETIRITISEVEKAATFACTTSVVMGKIVQIPGPQEYLGKDFTCTYNILVVTDKKIRITFPEFDVIENEDCLTSYVSIKNDAGEEIFRKFCGKMVPKEVIIPTNSSKIEVRFFGEYPASRLSFVASEVNSIEESCPVSPLNATGLLANIPSNGKYLPRNFRCTYVIGNGSGKHIKMEFQTIDIKDSDNCGTRYIRNEDTGTKHCSNANPLETLSNNSIITMSVELPGLPWADAISFAASEITSNQLVNCDGKQGVQLNTSFSKPGDSSIFPDFFECIYEITASEPKNHIKLDFTRFEIECDGRYVQLGTTKNDVATENNKYCGLNRPRSVTFTGSKVYVKVKLGDQRDYEGFAFTATEIKIDTDSPFQCVKKAYIATKDIHELKVPAEGQYLPPNFECSYTIDAPKGQNVEIEFVKFRIGEVDHCGENTLFVGKEPVEGLSAHLCGPTLPTHFPNKKPLIFIKLKGKSLKRDDGFVLKYKSSKLSLMFDSVSLVYKQIKRAQSTMLHEPLTHISHMPSRVRTPRKTRVRTC